MDHPVEVIVAPGSRSYRWWGTAMGASLDRGRDGPALPRANAASGADAGTAASSSTRSSPPVLERLLGGSAWLALQVPFQIAFSFWSLRLIVEAIGPDMAGAYRFAVGFGFIQLLFEFGTTSALQRQLSDAWARGDRAGVDQAIACGMNLQIGMAIAQVAAVVGVINLALPCAGFDGPSYRLVVQVLWLQAVTAPCLGLAVVTSSVLQAARRYDFVPRYELAITVLRFAILVLGVRVGIDFFRIVVAQTAVILILRIGPALWVMACELGHVPHLHGARWEDYKALGSISFYLALIQISVVLTDKVDTTILGFVLAEPGPQIAAYDVVSKPFWTLSQSGGLLASLVIPAVAGLMATRDRRGLERIKYDGTRLHIGVLLPVGLLAWIHAGSFLSLWFGRRLGYDAASLAPLMRLFLVAAIPLALSVPVNMAIGMNRIRVIAVSALVGSLANLPISCYLTYRLGVSGVIWGTVLTTLLSNLLVPGIYVFRVLKLDPWAFLSRAVGPPLSGALALIAGTWALRSLMPPAGPDMILSIRAMLLLSSLGVGVIAYLGGYVLVPAGREDLGRLPRWLWVEPVGRLDRRNR